MKQSQLRLMLEKADIEATAAEAKRNHEIQIQQAKDDNEKQQRVIQ